MDTSEIRAASGAVLLIALTVWYFFGERIPDAAPPDAFLQAPKA